MTTGVFLMVLCAAICHAAWNALVKVNSDRLAMMAIMMSTQVVVAALAVPFLAFPAPEVWLYILASTIFSTSYCVFLIKAYRYGDLSHVYPIARGSAPLVVALLSIVIVGESLSRQAALSVIVIALGIMSLALTRGADFMREPKAVFYALGTGLCIAGYTVIDGMGARLAGDAHSYSFWTFLVTGVPIVILATARRRGQILIAARQSWRVGIFGGIVSLLAYWIVIWAMTQAPLALVSAVRETSMVFAVLIGVFVLRERLSLTRAISIFMTLAGSLMAKISR